MPRPEPKTITLTIDGREVQAPENAMLVDAAKHGDVEIPVFCYEPKLGNPVGACRMCLVEIEGIGKLQTGCSTPVKDGMVVHTQTERVREAQRSVVEFLLVNHPLDCPVCDKGGECPLQDISFGWGGGISRFIEPKRHFVKPLELSPKIAIDRERCILCYRCVRFSQEISEDYQLVLLERGAHSFVSTFDGHPYVAPFSGNIIELCPVGALTSRSYRFRARPWDIEDAGTVCTLCPAQCNVKLTVRDERVLRVLSREHSEVDDGWLCDRGRFAYPGLAEGAGAHGRDGAAPIASGVVGANGAGNGHVEPAADAQATSPGPAAVPRVPGAPTVPSALTASATAIATATAPGAAHGVHVGMRVSEPLLRDGGELRPVTWERALEEAAVALKRAGANTAALAGGGTTNEEALLLGRLLREALGSPHLDSRAAGALPLELLQALSDPRLQAKVSDLEFAHSVLLLDCEPLSDAPILDLRLRKGVRRHGMTLERCSGEDLDELRASAKRLAEAGEELVILWSERFAAGAQGGERVRALLDLAGELRLAEIDGAGLLEIPASANGRGMREAGFLPNAAPGLRAAGETGRDTQAIAGALAGGELSALYLLHVDPLEPSDPFAAGAASTGGSDGVSWEQALERASTVVAHATLLTAGLFEHANVIFPAESYAEQEGTVTHPDGRLQRVRQAVARAGTTRPGWQVIAELSERLGGELLARDGQGPSQALFDAVAFYRGLTLEEIGGRGVRWQERPRTGTSDSEQGDDAGHEESSKRSAPDPEHFSGPEVEQHGSGGAPDPDPAAAAEEAAAEDTTVTDTPAEGRGAGDAGESA
ncbi:MAG TPA: molybdopterin-dependent oxidoreductase [Solirubrobacteraceae bacterium]|jgi:NADH-quinone oxidoreductase subunit G|nr:molybdopterin-dependent oxidoreductase [Solirubrobacteraceae bacterium]